MDYIKIRGARQHNLKNIDLDIPKNKFVVITGISGSGKSSLAFDTIYAEGQRRYVESLSAYARQFLGIMDKPDVTSIEGLSPAISIDQKTASHNPRSTVGTITEIYDYLRLLFARIGHPHCPNCKIEISKLSLDEIVDRVLLQIIKTTNENKAKPHEFKIYSPVISRQKGEFKELFKNVLSKGYSEVRIDAKEMNLADDISLIKTNKHSIDISIYRTIETAKNLKDKIYLSNLRSKLSTSIEQALNLSQGLVILNHNNKDSLFSEKFSCPNCNLSLVELEPRLFSFNSPLGACDRCKGIGTIYKVDPDLILNTNLTINEGAILPFNKLFFQDTWYIRLLKKALQEEGINLDKPLKELDKKEIKTILYGTGKVYNVPGTNRQGKQTMIYEKFDGVIGELERRFFESSGDFMGFEIQKYIREEKCDRCKGKRLKPEVLSITVDKFNISDVVELAVDDLIGYFETELLQKISAYEKQIAGPITKEIVTRMKFLKNVGLGYLTVGRTAKTLSGGELQRIRLASQIGTGLTGVLYVLDEPSIGLHPKDVSALIKTLKELRDLGNSLVVVEHDRETIESADYLFELGPKAGKGGGKVVDFGTISDITKKNVSLTGQFISGKRKIETRNKKLSQNKGLINLVGASQFNLKKINVKLPLGNLIAVTGVSGSGKSTLVVETLYPALKYYLDGYYSDSMGEFERIEGYQYLDRVYLVDQSPIGRTPRSNPATYVGFFDDIRDLFAKTTEAKAKGFKKGRFSFNLKGGRCEKCQGAGLLKVEMQFLSDVYVNCDVCDGKRYNKETLEIKFKGKTIHDVLEMTVDEAVPFFENHFNIHQKLFFLRNVGLGYIKLGQSAPTFSGGEAQRIKLANELSRRETGQTMYILDEPTTGLHFADIEKLLHTLYQLTEKGNTVVIIEHNLDVIKNCQYVIDLGPDGGDRGGRLVYQGELKGISKEKKSYTGEYLKKCDYIIEGII